MKEFKLKRTGEKPFKFVGELLAEVESSPETARSDYSGSTGRWMELSLYKTKGGKFICHRAKYTQWQGETTIYEGEVCDTEEEVYDFFGMGWLSKALYKNADLEPVEFVE